MRKKLFAIAGVALLASAAFAGLATAADHKDAPSANNDSAADITDIYAFRSPTNSDNLVVVTGFNPLTPPGQNVNVDTAVVFSLEVDNTGDLVPDATANFRFTSSPPTLTIEGLGAPISVPVTPLGQSPTIEDEGGIKAFAGLRDDPFFFDLAGFQAFIANPQAPADGLRPASAGPAMDSFAGTNILAIAVELPITALTGAATSDTGVIKVVGNANRSGAPVDRVAIPAVNTALVPSAQKDAFNKARDESQDVATFKPGVISTMDGLRAAVDDLFGTSQDGGPLGKLTSDQVASALLPFVVTIDFSQPVQFPNGRRLQDDVIDTALGLVLNRGGAAGISDGVDGNDKAALGTFPYLAAPHMSGAGPTGPTGGGAGGPITAPNTGDGGLVSSETGWMLSAGFLLIALTMAGTAAVATVRSRSR